MVLQRLKPQPTQRNAKLSKLTFRKEPPSPIEGGCFYALVVRATSALSPFWYRNIVLLEQVNVLVQVLINRFFTPVLSVRLPLVVGLDDWQNELLLF